MQESKEFVEGYHKAVDEWERGLSWTNTYPEGSDAWKGYEAAMTELINK